jgi:hypothetical protein
MVVSILGVWDKKWCHNEENKSKAITCGTDYNTSCSCLGILCWFGWHSPTSDAGSEFAYFVDCVFKPQMYFLQIAYAPWVEGLTLPLYDKVVPD